MKIDDTTTNGPILADTDLLGTGIGTWDDLDGDGIPDIAVGALGDDAGGTDRGAVHIMFLNRDGSVKSTVEINSDTANGPVMADGDFYGEDVEVIGDLDGDGVDDLAVGAVFHDTGGSNRGAAYIHFMNTNGSVKNTVRLDSTTANGAVLINIDQYGRGISAFSDLDGDEVVDLVVSALADGEGGSGRGAVHIHFMNTDGSVKSTVEINSNTANGPTLSNTDNYGAGVAVIGDLDGDGIEDLAVGAFGDDAGGSDRGAVHIHFMNTDGSVKSTVEINSDTANGPTLADISRYGKSIAPLGDFDGDGVIDIVVTANLHPGSGTFQGAAFLHFMNADGSVKETVQIDSTTTNGPSLSNSDGFGNGVGVMSDLDGNGVVDLVVGATGDDTGGDRRGATYIHFMAAVTVGGGGCRAPEIILDGPNPGEVLHSGMTKDIFWTANGCDLEDVDLHLSFDSGGTFIEIVALDLDVAANKGHYAWTVPDMPSTRGRLRAELSMQGGAVVAVDETPGDFIILGTQPGIPVLEPESQPEPSPDPEEGPTIDSELELQEGPAQPCVHGDLLKGSAPNVYYCGLDGERHVFANEDVYFSWFDSFDALTSVSDEILAGIPLGENVTLKPGTVIRIEAEPPIYEVREGQLLRHFVGEPPEDIITLSAAFVRDYRFE